MPRPTMCLPDTEWPIKISKKTYKKICVFSRPMKGTRAVARAVNRKTGTVKHFYPQHTLRKASMAKFKKLYNFGKQLYKIRQNYTNLIRSKNPRDQLYGVVLYLIDNLALRTGSRQHKKKHGTVGASTLERKHIFFQKDGCVVFKYPAKLFKKTKKIRETKPVCNEDVVETLHSLVKTNDYFTSRMLKMKFKLLLPKGITPKFFRTWRANVLFLESVRKKMSRRRPRQSRNDLVKQAIFDVSRELHHRPQVCKNYYVHPYVQEFVLNTGLNETNAAGIFKNVDKNPYQFKDENEKILMKILDEKYA